MLKGIQIQIYPNKTQAAKNILREGIETLINRRADGDSLCKLGMKGDESKYIMDSPIEQECLTEVQHFG